MTVAVRVMGNLVTDEDADSRAGVAGAGAVSLRVERGVLFG